MNLQIIRVCSGCGEIVDELEMQPDGKDYCSFDCFIKYNAPCHDCGEIVPHGEGVHYKEEGYTLCWKCACGEQKFKVGKKEVMGNGKENQRN